MSNLKAWTNMSAVYGQEINSVIGVINVTKKGYVKGLTDEQFEKLVDNNTFFEDKPSNAPKGATAARAAAPAPAAPTGAFENGKAYICVDGTVSPENEFKLEAVLNPNKFYQLGEEGGLDEIDPTDLNPDPSAAPGTVISMEHNALLEAVLGNYEDEELPALFERFGIKQGAAKKASTLRTLLLRKLEAAHWTEMITEAFIEEEEEEEEADVDGGEEGSEDEDNEENAE